jgi:hypothetical protein
VEQIPLSSKHLALLDAPKTVRKFAKRNTLLIFLKTAEHTPGTKPVHTLVAFERRSSTFLIPFALITFALLANKRHLWAETTHFAFFRTLYYV